MPDMRVGRSTVRTTPREIIIRVDPSCHWCGKETARGETTCVRCSRWLDDPSRKERWFNQRYSRVEVLSIGAAEIVRRIQQNSDP